MRQNPRTDYHLIDHIQLPSSANPPHSVTTIRGPKLSLSRPIVILAKPSTIMKSKTAPEITVLVQPNSISSNLKNTPKV